MSHVTLRVVMTGGDVFTIQLNYKDKILEVVKRNKKLLGYDLFYCGRRIYPGDTPLSLQMELSDVVDALRTAKVEDSKEMIKHIKECEFDASLFTFYEGGDIAICNLATLPSKY